MQTKNWQKEKKKPSDYINSDIVKVEVKCNRIPI